MYVLKVEEFLSDSGLRSSVARDGGPDKVVGQDELLVQTIWVLICEAFAGEMSIGRLDDTVVVRAYNDDVLADVRATPAEILDVMCIGQRHTCAGSPRRPRHRRE